MSSLLRIGITGFGGAGIAQLHHFRTLEGCRVVAVHDPSPAALDRARRHDPRVSLHDDFAAFLQAGLDAVAVCSPDRTHAPYLVASLRAGKHVICEKPLADSLDACRSILEAERGAPGIIAAVQHQMRFLPLHQKMKRLIDAGRLGRVFYMEGYYVHNLTARAWLYDSWRERDHATPLVYSGCHFVDLLRWLSGQEVVEVTAMANHIAFPDYPESDLNVALLRFASGLLGKVVVAFGAGRPQDHSVRVWGSDRCIENNLLFEANGGYSVIARPFLRVPPDRAWSVRRRLGFLRRGLKPVVLGRLMEAVMRWSGRRGDYAVQHYPLRLYEHEYAVRASLHDFVSAVRTGRPPRCRLADAAQTVAVCLAGVDAFRSGRAVAMSGYSLGGAARDR